MGQRLSYSELIKLPTFIDRYRYLKIAGIVGAETFGCDRWLNQHFYKDSTWLSARNYVIVRDSGCDLGILDRSIEGNIFVHHINPITKHDILNRSPWLFNPDNLICCSFSTHNAIHYGDETLLVSDPVVRSPNDTCPWRH